MAVAYIAGRMTAEIHRQFDEIPGLKEGRKDAAGPSINTQITVVSLVASLASGLFIAFSIM